MARHPDTRGLDRLGRVPQRRRSAACARRSRRSPRTATAVSHLRSEGQAEEKELNPIYYEAAGEPKTLWEVEGAGHTGGIDADPDEYQRRVLAFFDQALLDESDG
jgi:hypothetical protein